MRFDFHSNAMSVEAHIRPAPILSMSYPSDATGDAAAVNFGVRAQCEPAHKSTASRSHDSMRHTGTIDGRRTDLPSCFSDEESHFVTLRQQRHRRACAFFFAAIRACAAHG
jgi:hypothetical protein